MRLEVAILISVVSAATSGFIELVRTADVDGLKSFIETVPTAREMLLGTEELGEAIREGRVKSVIGGYYMDFQYLLDTVLSMENTLFAASSEGRVPKIVHLFWIGSALPNTGKMGIDAKQDLRYVDRVDLWCKIYDDWEIILWYCSDILKESEKLAIVNTSTRSNFRAYDLCGLKRFT